MGIVIGAVDWSRRISSVSPMPAPEYNVLVAIRTLASGKVSSIATNTIGRSAGLVINAVTANMPEFSFLFTSAFAAYKSTDAEKNKVAFSRLTNLLLNIGLSKVNEMCS